MQLTALVQRVAQVNHFWARPRNNKVRRYATPRWSRRHLFSTVEMQITKPTYIVLALAITALDLAPTAKCNTYAPCFSVDGNRDGTTIFFQKWVWYESGHLAFGSSRLSHHRHLLISHTYVNISRFWININHILWYPIYTYPEHEMLAPSSPPARCLCERSHFKPRLLLKLMKRRCTH